MIVNCEFWHKLVSVWLFVVVIIYIHVRSYFWCATGLIVGDGRSILTGDIHELISIKHNLIWKNIWWRWRHNASAARSYERINAELVNAVHDDNDNESIVSAMYVDWNGVWLFGYVHVPIDERRKDCLNMADLCLVSYWPFLFSQWIFK